MVAPSYKVTNTASEANPVPETVGVVSLVILSVVIFVSEAVSKSGAVVGATGAVASTTTLIDAEAVDSFPATSFTLIVNTCVPSESAAGVTE